MKVENELSIGKYKVLLLDKNLPLKPFKAIRIKNKEFKIIIPYDLKNSIAIESDGDFINETVEFI